MIQPLRYRLDIQPHFQHDNFSMYGQVWIDIKVLNSTEAIVLHCSKELKILKDSVRVELLQNQSLPVLAASLKQKYKTPSTHSNCTLARLDNDLFRISECVSLLVGKHYRLHLQFRGQLSKGLTGFYRSSYFDPKTNETRWLASTTFEPNQARRTFPCFDEPGFKSRFQVNLASQWDDVALSNMPSSSVKNMTGVEGWKWTRFKETPLMSSYLVAFFVGKLESRETHTDAGTSIRVWARPAVVSQAKYALDIAPRILSFFNKLLGVVEPLPKHDILALPRFVADALENWGLISFGEKHLLYEPGASPALIRQQVAKTLSHELAHSWFGNMVSVRWWKDIWLNEGFATYFSALGTNHVQNSWDALSMATVTAFLYVFTVDSLHSSPPLTVPIDSQNDLQQIFSTVTYYKGYYLLRMLNHTLGERSFIRGCRLYVQRNRYRAVDQQDLWDALTEQAHRDGTLSSELHLSQLMYAWTSRPGFPVLNVVRNYTTGTATITQARFQRSRQDVETRKTDTSWWVPLTYTSQANPDFSSTKPRIWLSPSYTETQLKNLPGDEHWMLFNIQAAGLYRVNYDHKNWELISNFLNSDKFSSIAVLNRALLLDDALDLARVGLLPYQLALNVTSYLHQETVHLPWKSALSNLGYIARMLRLTDALPHYKKFIQRLVEPQYKELRFQPHKNDSYLKSLHHKEIVKWACHTEVSECVLEAKQLFHNWMEGKTINIPRSLREVMYCTAVQHGGPEEWDRLWAHYKNSSAAFERSSILQALGCSQNLEVLRKYISWGMNNESGVQPEDSCTVFKAVASSDVGFNTAKELFFNNVETIATTAGQFSLTEILDTIASRMNQKEHLNELQIFQKSNTDKIKSFTRSISQVNERVKYNIQWIEKNYNDINSWLVQRTRS